MRRLETHTTTKLHAGQLATDLSSIVKELLENALDAGARQVGVSLLLKDST
jgi:DNA mismatch repair ATPase MutL